MHARLQILNDKKGKKSYAGNYSECISSICFDILSNYIYLHQCSGSENIIHFHTYVVECHNKPTTYSRYR